MSNTHLRISGIVKESIVDGPGLRDTLFTQGCSHQCPGCHNPQTWNYHKGKLKSVDELTDQFKDTSQLTLSGGEPFDQASSLIQLLKRLSVCNVWAYSGYTYEEIIKDPIKKELLNYIDVLVDGRFVQTLRSLNCPYRGSSNQRLIDVKQSLASDSIVLWQEKHEKASSTPFLYI